MGTNSHLLISEAVEAAEHGGRQPEGVAKSILLYTAVFWSLFQLWVASPLSYNLGFGVFNDSETRFIHLALALFLAYISFPWHRGRISHRIPILDWLLALCASSCALYLFLFYNELAGRSGSPTAMDVSVAIVGVLLLLEATRRALGWPLTIIASMFLVYTFAGPWLPDVIAHKGASLQRVASHPGSPPRGCSGCRWEYLQDLSFCLSYLAACWNRQGAVPISFASPSHWWGICVVAQLRPASSHQG